MLGKILQRLEDQGYAKVSGYNTFKLIKETDSSVTLLREKGTDTMIPFKKILAGIDYYKANSAAYDKGPTELRKVPITHITSPIFTLLHLIPKKSYKVSICQAPKERGKLLGGGKVNPRPNK